MINIYTGAMLLSAFLSALSQLLLKMSAKDTHKSKIFEYLNFKVITGYGLLMLTLLINTWAYQGVAYKIGPVINATSYIFVMLLGRFVLSEKLTTKKLIGIIFIIAGILISALL